LIEITYDCEQKRNITLESSFSQFYLAAKKFLNLGADGVLSLFHTQLLLVVCDRYELTKRRWLASIHRVLGEFFLLKIDPNKNLHFEGKYTRGFNEIVFHIVECQNWILLQKVLNSLYFVRQRYLLNQHFLLMADYSEALNSELPQEQATAIKEFSAFVHQKHTLFLEKKNDTTADIFLTEAKGAPNQSQPYRG